MDIQLNSLILQNFQAIRDRTEIPIRPLTFLYGPNSSGKSAIHDALLYVDAVLKGHDHKVDLLNRWRYRVPKDTESRDMEVIVSGTVLTWHFGYDKGQTSLPVLFINALYDYKQDAYEAGKGVNISIGIKELTDYSTLISLFIDDKCVLRFHSPEPDVGTVKCEISTEFFGDNLKGHAAEYDLDPNDPSSYSFSCRIREAWPMQVELVDLGEQDEFDVLKSSDFANSLCHIANYYLAQFAALKFLPPLVDSDRGTILHDTLTWTNSTVGYLLKTHPSIAKLAKSHIARFQDSQNKPKALAAEGLDTWVNRCLSDQLFLDQAYQIAYKAYGLTPLSVTQTNGLENDKSTQNILKTSHDENHLVECTLIDKVGRATNFEDVGTGVSCLIPVLVSLHYHSSFIQQPELHLHPALQAALGDVCIEAAQDLGVRHLIETHSEHLLLRVLKRIRQTHLQNSIAPELKIEADDVCVLYFNPLPDGTTAVKRLRITEDGEFMDRWPRGFFAERDQELFDE